MSTEVTYDFKSKLKLASWFALAYGVFYIFPNFYAPWVPNQLPLTWLDKNIPFIPWTFLIYTSDYFLIFLTVLLIKEPQPFRSFARTMFATLFICGCCFLVFPTTYPRPIYPIDEAWWVQSAMNLVYVADSPNNCFPSMHVALTSIATLNLRKYSKKLFIVFAFWTLAIIGSTLTTKQHYFVDVMGGLSVVVIVSILENRVLENLFKRSQKVKNKIETTDFTRVF